MNKKTVIAVIALVVVVALLGAAYFLTRPSGVWGPKEFTLEIVHKDGQTKTLEITANEEFLGEYLEKEGIIEGAEGPYGMYIAKVEGVKAVYEEDGAYWAFYVDGEYASLGVDQTPIENGKVYKLQYEAA
ncbi:MAG: DUF4430 domain-containing protein [Oscillospiraceae bacterium]|nr:DUF4430 domain-containing protein [Oscillospiraceae bacterium]